MIILRKDKTYILSLCVSLIVLLLFRYAGVNATDVNFSAGRYSGPNPPLPMDVGLEVNS